MRFERVKPIGPFDDVVYTEMSTGMGSHPQRISEEVLSQLYRGDSYDRFCRGRSQQVVIVVVRELSSGRYVSNAEREYQRARMQSPMPLCDGSCAALRQQAAIASKSQIKFSNPTPTDKDKLLLL